MLCFQLLCMYIYFAYLKNMIYKLKRKKYKINIQQKKLIFLESFAKLCLFSDNIKKNDN